MPPLKQPKELSFLCYSVISIHTASVILYSDQSGDRLQRLQDHFKRHLPTVMLEKIFSWIVQASSGLIVHDDRDDIDILREHCCFLRKACRILLTSRMKTIDVDYAIDLGLFQNFDTNAFGEIVDESGEREKILSNDENLTELPEVMEVVNEILAIVSKFEHLEIFSPGLYVIGRRISDILEPPKYSLCWQDPRTIIKVVELNKETLSILNLEGYQDLNDLVLEYISGATDESDGLKNLREITLPKQCYITDLGIKALLENLPNLELVNHPGKMGHCFEKGLQLCFDRDFMMLNKLCQLESMTSGGQDNDEWLSDDFDINPWVPSKEAVTRIATMCPFLTQISVLMNDTDLEKLTGLPDLQEIEAHVTWSGTSGLDLLAISSSQTLTKIQLTLLEGYSWTVITAIGQYCQNLQTFHLTLWSDNIEDAEVVNVGEGHFCALEELKIKCEDQVEEFPEVVFLYFMAVGHLKIVDIRAPLHWLTQTQLQLLRSHLEDLEMLILSNISTVSMQLGLNDVRFLLETCPKLTILGNLRTWSGIDYFNPQSDLFYKTESEFCKLKQEAASKNWDIDFDFSNLDFIT